jgi:uncharacterized repeat protein (TIGR03803 family)
MNLTRTVVILIFFVFNFQSTFSQNKIWGMTAMGGSEGFGVIFTTNADGSNYQVIHHFDGVNGSIPESKLVKAPNGKFYGTTLSGGTSNDGVLFEIDQNGNYSKKIDFHDGTLGSRIQGGLTLGHNGKLYGTTWSGGTNYDGTIFKYDIEKQSLHKIADFDNEGLAIGSYPFASLVLAYNGKFYGTTYAGGEHGLGTIFELDPVTDVVTKKFDFIAEVGGMPAFNMTLAPNGKLYGTGGSGGTFGFGTIFVFDPSKGTCEKVHDFDGAETGAIPIGTLTLAYNGKLYGTNSWGGQYNNGTLFEFDYRNQTITKRFDFDKIETGKAPRGGLLQSTNGKLYGTTEQGGVHGQGVIFEFNPYNGSFAKKRDFSMPDGGQAQSCEMTLLGNHDRALQSIQFDAMSTLDVKEPKVDLPATASSGLPLVYYSSDPDVASVSENKLMIHKIGSVSITATQAGDASYHAAADVSRLFSIDSVGRTELITGIEENPDPSFDVIVRENPFRSSLRFQVNTSQQTPANIVLYSMKGDRVHESLQQSNTAVDLQLDFKPGLYLLGVQTPQGRKLIRVLCLD